MNYKRLILAVTALAFFFSCNVREESLPLVRRVSFQAVMADNPSSKTVLQGDGSVYWSPRDSISLFCGELGVQLIADNTEPVAQATFLGTLDEFPSEGEFWAVYPYDYRNTFDGQAITLVLPDKQVARAGTYTPGLFPSMARSTDYTLQFYNLCGGVKFSVASEGIESVIFKGNNGEILAGQVKASFNADGRPQVEEVVKGASSLRLDAPDGGFEVGKWYYIVSLPAELTAGYCMTFFKNGEMFSERVSEDPVTIKRAVWGRLTNADEVPEPFSASKYLTFTSEGTSTISLKNTGGNEPVLYYSTDQDNWSKWDYGELSFSANAPLYLCGSNPDGFSSSTAVCSYFASSGDLYHVSGDVMSLIDKDTDQLSLPCEYCFVYLFYHCTNLASAPDLPATTLSKSGYRSMFNGCMALTDAPALPATELADACYYSMFSNCTGLVNAPEELPAMAVPGYAYRGMFNNCTSLETGPVLPATTLDEACYEAMFYACSGLTSAPELPATELSFACYHFMFWGCTSLTEAPELPATTLTEDCYNCMFYGCSSLLATPALPATTVAPYCYYAMFSGGCSSLSSAPEVLPATTVYESSYQNMFWSCTSLTTAPALPATTLAKDCYRYMFWGCTNLESVPELPATTLAEGCYYNMFGSCSAIESAPELPAATLADSCYFAMFESSPNLQYVKCLATNITASGCVNYWLSGVAGQGTFIKASDVQWPTGASGIPEGWTVEDAISANNYLTFTSQGTSSVYLSSVGGGAQPILYYSYDTVSWELWDYSMLTFTADTPLYLCGDNPEGFSFDVSAYSTLGIYGDNCSVSGDVMSLLDKDDELTEIPNPYCFAFLFGGSSLVSGPDLPATTLTTGCYYGMFQSNSGLTSTPSLPAETLAENCYANMFYGCTGLTAAPELPAATLASSCYANMFNGCTGLTSAPSLSATELAYRCYYGMFQECSSLLAAPVLPATTMAEECYYTMFQGCSKLETAPELSATTLATGCYMGMFSTCTSLTEAPELPAITLAASCYYNMFAACTKLVSAPELPATTLEYACYAGMFSGCTSLTEAPVLPAQSLENMCYASLFTGCTSLNYVMCLATENLGGSNTGGWLANVAATGTFVKAPNAQWESGMSGIPEGWEVVDAQ